MTDPTKRGDSRASGTPSTARGLFVQPRPARHTNAARLAAKFAIGALALTCVAADGDDQYEQPEYNRADPDLPGGERYGADDGDDGFTGYPVDAGDPNDRYHDTTTEYRGHSPNWTGAFVGGGLYSGPVWVGGRHVDSRTIALQYGAFIQAATLMGIGDLQLSYSRFNANNVPIQGIDTAISRNSITASVHIHPGLLAIINGPGFGYPIQSFYVTGGGGWDFVGVESDQFQSNYNALSWHLGTGIDLPIDSPQDGGAFWIGIQYRLNHVPGDRDIEVMRRQRFRESALMLRITYRRNGNVLNGFRGPQIP